MKPGQDAAIGPWTVDRPRYRSNEDQCFLCGTALVVISDDLYCAQCDHRFEAQLYRDALEAAARLADDCSREIEEENSVTEDEAADALSQERLESQRSMGSCDIAFLAEPSASLSGAQEALRFLVLAAVSGIAGNLATDALKTFLRRVRRTHAKRGKTTEIRNGEIIVFVRRRIGGSETEDQEAKALGAFARRASAMRMTSGASTDTGMRREDPAPTPSGSREGDG